MKACHVASLPNTGHIVIDASDLGFAFETMVTRVA